MTHNARSVKPIETFALLGRLAGNDFAADRARNIYASPSFTILRPDQRIDVVRKGLWRVSVPASRGQGPQYVDKYPLEKIKLPKNFRVRHPQELDSTHRF